MHLLGLSGLGGNAQQVQQMQHAQQMQMGAHNPKSARVCQHWQAGKCDYGNACSFRHDGAGALSGRPPPSGRAGLQASPYVQMPPRALPALHQAAPTACGSAELIQANQALATLGIDLSSLLQAAASPLQVPQMQAAHDPQTAMEEMQLLENLGLAQIAQGPAAPAAGLSMGGKSSRPCNHWSQFKCEYGDACRFSHDGPGGASPKGPFPGGSFSQQMAMPRADMEPVPSQGAGTKRDRVCAHWTNYKCNYGDTCSFKHEGLGGVLGGGVAGEGGAFAAAPLQEGEFGQSVRFSPY